MRPRKLFLAAAAVVPALALLTSPAPAQDEPTLKIGDAAPALSGKVNWLKGEPVNQYKTGQTYIIDFWATWCGPCIAAMPHINDVANEYRDKNVTIIGLAIWPRENSEPTREFVTNAGDEMNYVVAEDIDDISAKAYMDAAGQYGIPTTMIIDRNGRLAWIGHPMMNLEGALEMVLAEDYSIDTLVARQREIDRGNKLLEEAERLATTGDWDGSFKVIDEVVAISHEEFGYLALIKFQYLLGRFERHEEGYAYGRSILDSVIKNDPILLENFAKFILEGPGFEDNRDFALAHKAVQRAAELTDGKEPAVLDTLAQVCFALGDAAAAHAACEQALALVDDPRVKADLEARLAQYAEAMKKQPG